MSGPSAEGPVDRPDIVGFLRARIAEDEVAANCAADDTSAEWTYNDEGPPRFSIVEGGSETIVYDEGSPSDAEAVHIARHDPARVLREVEAKRRIVDDLAPLMGLEREDYDWAGTAIEQAERHLRLLAMPYSDHADYREEWRP